MSSKIYLCFEITLQKKNLAKKFKEIETKETIPTYLFYLDPEFGFENKSTEFEILKKFIENIKKIISDKFKIWIIFDNIKIYKQILILSKIDMMKEIEFFFLYQSVIKIIV